MVCTVELVEPAMSGIAVEDIVVAVVEAQKLAVVEAVGMGYLLEDKPTAVVEVLVAEM